MFEESCILPSLITKLIFWIKNCVLWIVVGSKKLSYVTIQGWTQYNISKYEESPSSRIKLILKFHKDCNFAGWFLIHLFFLLIFLLSFLVNLRIALSRTDWFISVITGLIELLWLRWITWKTETTFCLGMPFLV